MRSLLLPGAFVSSAIVAMLAMACSDGTTAGNDGGPTNDGSVTGDSGNKDGGSITGGDGGASSFSIYVTPDNGPVSSSAYFSLTSSGTTGCTTTTSGVCRLEDCGDGGASVTTPSDDPGTLTATGGTPPIVLTLALAGGYYTVSSATAADSITEGSSVTLAGTGATVPALSDTLTIPTFPVITQPTADGGITSVARASDLAVAWTGGNLGSLSFAISVGNKFVSCEFPTSSGTNGTVPTSLLSQLPAGPAIISATALNRDAKPAGAYQVQFLAASIGPTLTKVTLQ